MFEQGLSKSRERWVLGLGIYLGLAQTAAASTTPTGFPAFQKGIDFIGAVIALFAVASILFVVKYGIELADSQGARGGAKFITSLIAAVIAVEAKTGGIPGLNLQVAMVL